MNKFIERTGIVLYVLGLIAFPFYKVFVGPGFTFESITSFGLRVLMFLIYLVGWWFMFTPICWIIALLFLPGEDGKEIRKGCFVWCLILIVLSLLAIMLGDFSGSTNNNKKYRHKSSYSSGLHRAYEALPDIVDSVYICTSRSSYAFHARYSCGALGRCNSPIAKIPVEKAWKMNRSPCERCSKYVKFKGME